MDITVLYQFDDIYAPYGGISIFSLLENNKNMENIRIYILDDMRNPISEDNKQKLSMVARNYNRDIHIMSTDVLIDLLDDLGIPTYRGCYAANMRMFLDKVLPDIDGRVLYLDADTIVVDSLEDLIKVDLGERAIIGMTQESLGSPIKNSIGLSDSDKYYNSGVIIFDIDKWKKNRCSDKIISHAREKRASYISPDQDLINVVLKDYIYDIGPQYNFQPLNRVYEYDLYRRIYNLEGYYEKKVIVDAIENVCIYHCYRYIGSFPWHKNTKHPFVDIWDSFMEKSPWRDYKKENAKHGMVVEIEKFLFDILSPGLFLRLFKLVSYYSVIKSEQKLKRSIYIK